MVLAKLFDKDGDGKLNETERAAADKAIQNVRFLLFLLTDFCFQGIDKKMVWNVD